MKTTWDLSALFTDREACERAIKELEDKVDKLTMRKGEKLIANSLQTILDDYFVCRTIAYEALVYGSICFYADTSEDNAKFKTFVEHKNEDVIGSLGFVNDMILSLDQDKIDSMLQENRELEKYRFYIQELFRKRRHAITSPEITKIKKEISSLIQKYNDILKGITFDNIADGDKQIELNSGIIPKYLASRNPDTRRQTYLSLNRGYETVETDIVALVDELYKKRAKLAKLLGYRNVLEMALDEENIDPKVLDTLIAIVNDKKPLLQKYMAEKTRIEGFENPHLYDLGLPLDSGYKRKYPLDECRELLEKIFTPVGKDYTDKAIELLDTGHVDSEIRENKHQITFSWYGYSFLNYHATYGDLKNLVHELGHSINDILSQKLPFPYKISSVFIGETASIVNEILLVRTLLKNADTEEEKLFYLSKEIDNYISSVYRQTLFTEYEMKLYAKVESGDTLTKEFLESTYTSLIKSYYGDDIVYDEELKYEWMRLGHQIRWTFYSFQYATGLLIASTAYANLISGELTEKEYLNFLSAGSKESSLDLLTYLHIDLKNMDILAKGFDVLENDLETLSQFKPDKIITHKKCETD